MFGAFILTERPQDGRAEIFKGFRAMFRGGVRERHRAFVPVREISRPGGNAVHEEIDGAGFHRQDFACRLFGDLAVPRGTGRRVWFYIRIVIHD